MTLYLIGIGLEGEKDITIKGREAINQCDFVYLENYTSLTITGLEEREVLYEKRIILADRNLVESNAENTMLKNAKENNVAFLVIGDPLVATTHTDLLLRAKKLNITTEIIHNASIFTAITETGLQLYKFGPTTSIPFSEQESPPETPYKMIQENVKRGLHTLVLLDVRTPEKVCMNIRCGLAYLEQIEKKLNGNILEDRKIVGCAGIGTSKGEIVYGTAKHLKHHQFMVLPQCIIVPGRLHFMEEEFLEQFNI